jgi:arylsulfatase A-like enzyme
MRAAFATIREHTRPGTVLATRWPGSVSWYGDRPVIDTRSRDIRALGRLGARIDGLVYGTGDVARVRRHLRKQGIFTDFREVAELPNAMALWLRRGVRGARGPASVAHPRPGEPARLRLVVLYAPCTVNADYLEPYREAVFFTPEIRAFSREALVFDRHQTEADQSGTAYAALLSGRQAPGHRVFSHPVAMDERPTLITEAFAAAGWDVHFWANQGMASPRHKYAQGVPRRNIVQRRDLSGEDERFRAILDRLAAEPSYRALVVANFTVSHYPYPDRIAELEARFPTETAGLLAGLSDPDVAWAKGLYQFRLDLQKNFPAVQEQEKLSGDRLRTLTRVVELLYVSGIAHLDALFGSLVRAVDGRGLRDESLLVFTADHGELLYRDNALFPWSHDFQLAPEVLRVPLLIRGPGIAPGRVASVTRSIDVYPTLAGLAGVPVDDGGVTGVDLAPVLRGEAAPPALQAFSHTPKVRSDIVQRAQASWHHFARYYPSTDIEEIWVSVRDGDRVFKLRKMPDGSFGYEHFDLSSDPEERHDLFRRADSRHAEMAARLDRYKAEIVAAHDAAEAERATPELEERQLRALRELGYVQ